MSVLFLGLAVTAGAPAQLKRELGAFAAKSFGGTHRNFGPSSATTWIRGSASRSPGWNTRYAHYDLTGWFGNCGEFATATAARPK